MPLPLYGEANGISSTVAGEGKDKHQRLIEAGSSTKSLFASWIYNFDKS